MTYIYRLTVKSHFSSAHQLRHYQGACENLHGHNFQVAIVVQGTELSQDTNILLDFKELKSKLKEITDYLDHKNLNQLDPFLKKNPSSENLAHFIFTELEKKIPPGIQVHRVSVSENENSMATVLREKN